MRQAINSQLSYHATFVKFKAKDIYPLSHFGSLDAARERADYLYWQKEKARVICGWIDMKNPLEIKDTLLEHKPSDVVLSILTSDPFCVDEVFYEKVALIEKTDRHSAALMVCDHLRSAGYDGLVYENLAEDEGSMGWIILDASQIKIAYDLPLDDVLHMHEMTFEGFMKEHWISDEFEIDGTSEDYEHIWEAINTGSDRYPLIDSGPDGWTVRWLNDWDPAGTVALFDPDGEPQGFYMGGQCWINPAARGRGLSSALIANSSRLLGGSPIPYDDGFGFSEPGYAAHLSAWRAERLLNGKNPDFEPEADNSPSLIFY